MSSEDWYADAFKEELSQVNSATNYHFDDDAIYEVVVYNRSFKVDMQIGKVSACACTFRFCT